MILFCTRRHYETSVVDCYHDAREIIAERHFPTAVNAADRRDYNNHYRRGREKSRSTRK